MATDSVVKPGKALKGAIWIMALVLGASVALNAFLGFRFAKLRAVVERGAKDAELQAGVFVPPIHARGADGKQMLIDYSQASIPTILYFFSPGCDTCAANSDNFKSLAGSKSKEYRILALALSDEGLDEY